MPLVSEGGITSSVSFKVTNFMGRIQGLPCEACGRNEVGDHGRQFGEGCGKMLCEGGGGPMGGFCLGGGADRLHSHDGLKPELQGERHLREPKSGSAGSWRQMVEMSISFWVSWDLGHASLRK